MVSNSSAERLLSQPVGLSLLFLGISIHLGSFPERVTKMFGKQSVRFGVCTYISWKNSGSRVRSLSKTFFLLPAKFFKPLVGSKSLVGTWKLNNKTITVPVLSATAPCFLVTPPPFNATPCTTNINFFCSKTMFSHVYNYYTLYFL